MYSSETQRNKKEGKLSLKIEDIPTTGVSDLKSSKSL